jgi:hypothetical protein
MCARRARADTPNGYLGYLLNNNNLQCVWWQGCRHLCHSGTKIAKVAKIPMLGNLASSVAVLLAYEPYFSFQNHPANESFRLAGSRSDPFAARSSVRFVIPFLRAFSIISVAGRSPSVKIR